MSNKRVKTVNLSDKISPMNRDNTVPSVTTDMKTCSSCKQAKPFGDFAPREYRCKVCMAEKARAWNRKNRDRFNANKRRSHHNTKHTEHAAKVREIYKRQREKIRAEVFAAYGGYECACCLETNPLFLTIDHVNNDGAEHRREIWQKSRNGSGSALYAWLKKQDFPPGFQVLCFNCNCAKQRNGGICPHLSDEGVTTRASARTLKRGEVRAIPTRDDEIVCSASQDAAAYLSLVTGLRRRA